VIIWLCRRCVNNPKGFKGSKEKKGIKGRKVIKTEGQRVIMKNGASIFL
jgi:hypothetical protein